MTNIYTKKINTFAFIIAIIAALGGFTLGFDAGFVIDGKDQIISHFNLSDFQWSWIVSISIIGSVIAIPISGRFVDLFGSKNLLLLTALGFILGLLLTASAHTLSQLVIGRFIIGICIGIASYASPLYISEISAPTVRGGMILFNGIAITAGQALSFLAAYFLHDRSISSWRYLLELEMIPAALLLFGLLFMPQSPRWIAKQGIEFARNILKKIRPHNPVRLEQELNDIQLTIPSLMNKATFKKLFSKKILPALLVGASLGALQQFIGISAIMYYGPVVFQAVGFDKIKSGIFATFCIGTINCIFTIISAFLVDYLGRRFLLLVGTLIAAISMFLIGYTSLGKISDQWGMFFVATYIIGYCISIGSLFWVLISEIFPTYIRGTAMSFATMIQCIANFLVSISFLAFVNYLGNGNTFFLYGIMSIVAFIFIYYFVPETKGVSLEVIELNLNKGKNIRRLGESHLS